MAEESKKTIRITAGDIQKALDFGYPLTCATCVHFYTACASGLLDCGKTACGGPIVGRDYPDYKGQIPREKFPALCLMCGDSKIAYKVVVTGESKFALCEKHKDALSGIIVDPQIALNQATPLIIPIL